MATDSSEREWLEGLRYEDKFPDDDDEAESRAHDHDCCPPDDCCGGPCAAHPCWDLTT